MYTLDVELSHRGFAGQFTDGEGITYHRHAMTVGELLATFARIIGCTVDAIRIVRC